MDPRLLLLIQRYQAAVAAAVASLEQSGIPRPSSNDAWASNGLPQSGTLVNGATYFKHGYGCAVRGPSGSIDFDFGNAGQIDGFDIGRLWSFAQANGDHHGFASENELKQVFAAATEASELQPSDYILSYLVHRR